MADLASLVIGLRADVATLQSDLGKAAALNQRYAKQASDSWTNAAADIGQALGAAIATFAVAGAALAKNAIDAADGLNKMSQKVGVSVESLSALNVQAKLSDVSIDQLQGGMAKLAKNAADAASGSKQQAAAFEAMGVSLKDANGNLRSTEQILGDVATKFSSYADSASKTALAQQIFGKSGAELIPLLNQLGTEGFAKAREEAEKYGAVISGDTAKQAEQFNDNLTKLKLETQGFANAVVADLLPSLITLTDQFVKAGETTDKYGSTASVAANAIKSLAFAAIVVKEAIASIATVLQAFYEGISAAFSAAYDVVQAWAVAVGKQLKAAFTLDGAGFDAATAQYQKALSAASDKMSVGFGAVKEILKGGIGDSIDSVKGSFDALFGTFANVAAGSTTTAKAIGGLNAPLLANADAADKAAKALQDYAAAQNAAGSFLAKLQGAIDPVNKAYQDYVQTIIQANKISQQLVDTGTKAGQAVAANAQAQEFLAKATGLANVALDDQLAKLAAQGDVLGRITGELNDQAAMAGLSDREKFIADAVHKATDEWEKNSAAMIANKNTLDEVKSGTEAAAAATYDLMQRAKDSQEVARGFASIWSGAANSIADAFAKAVVEGGNFLHSLADIAKQVVEQIISYFAKLAVINPILNAVFGSAAGGGSLLPTLASAGGLFGGGGGAAGATGGTGSLFDVGQGIWNGMKSGFASFMQGDSAFTMGPPTVGGSTSSYYGGGYSSGFGQALGVAGGVYAGYNRYQQAGGGLGGVAGGAAYGVGTYAAGAGLATFAATGSLTAGLAAIGPIGWVAIGLMVIDTMSGGKLFGTKGKFNFGEQALTVGAGGATVTAGYDLKGQQALFGGSTHSWQSLPTDPAAQKAADDFYKALSDQTDEFAKQFGAKVGDIVGGQFIATFDKKGNVTATSSTVLGKTYNEDQQHFEERLSAENMLAVLDSLNKGLSDAVDQYRADADQLMAVTQALAQGEAMIQAGTNFLALGSDQSLTALLALAQGMQGFGETIDQTLQRIEQAQSQYDAFVGQFKPADTFASPFQAALADIDAQMEQNIATANSLAQAAGAEGAATEDLVHIHEFAAAQFAAAVKKLESDANSLVASLGYGMPQSLSDINSQIAELESQANSGSDAISGFGDAMQSAAQAATNAMNLLLGDLSPLNDQQKLQTALQGLRAGTVTAEQVLEIGRRLYATGSDYNALFSQVMAMNRGAHAMVGASGDGGGGLSPGDQQRLADLKAERDKQQAIQQHSDALTLAQQIADIAGATGMSIDDVLKQIGLDDLPDFMKELGVTDKTGFDNFIEKLEQNKDSAGENTAQIADKLDLTNTLLQQIRDGTTGPAAPPGTPTGHSGHALQQNTDAVNNLNTTIQSGGNTGNRSSRGGFDRAVLQRTR